MHIATSYRRLALLVLLTALATCLHLESDALAQRFRGPGQRFEAQRFQTQRFQPQRFQANRFEGSQARPRFQSGAGPQFQPGYAPRLQSIQMHKNQPAQRPAPAAQAPQGQRRPGQLPGGNPANRGAKGEHLAEWMNQHSNLSPEQQQRALEQEPGFHELPPQTQQRYRDRLAQLNAMNPQKRQELLNRNEAIEKLTPDQRGQVRGAMQQLGALPPDQRRVVARSFRELRDLPPEQRYAAMGRLPLNDAQRATLGNLLRVEPLLPPPEK